MELEQLGIVVYGPGVDEDLLARMKEEIGQIKRSMWN